MTHPRGRQPIGVNQPPGAGHDYPFVAPASDIALLFGDFYLSYEDNDYALPLRVAWLYGFGDNVVSALPGFPTPVHTRDLVVMDADDQVVFDSTTADDYVEVSWAARLLTIEWKAARAVCRCTIHTEFSPQQDVITYDLYIAPDNGELDSRTYERLPRRVRSLVVSGQEERRIVHLVGGYNVKLTAGARTRRDGGRSIKTVTLQSQPGDGLGRVPGCQDPTIYLRRINGVPPDEKGRFNLDLRDCLKAYPPLTVTVDGDGNRIASYYDPSLTVTQAKSALILEDDCTPCCSCEDFVNTYKGLKRVYDRWSNIASAAEAVRDQMAANRNRWQAQRDCRMARPLRVVSHPETGCTFSLGAGYCNMTACCLGPVVIRLTLQHYVSGVLAGAPAGLSVLRSSIDGSATQGETPYVLGGSWPIFEATFPTMDPQSAAILRTRFRISGCDSSSSIRAHVTAHAPAPADPACELPTADVPGEVAALWASNAPAYPTRAMTSQTMPVDSSPNSFPCT